MAVCSPFRHGIYTRSIGIDTLRTHRFLGVNFIEEQTKTNNRTCDNNILRFKKDRLKRGRLVRKCSIETHTVAFSGGQHFAYLAFVASVA